MGESVYNAVVFFLLVLRVTKWRMVCSQMVKIHSYAHFVDDSQPPENAVERPAGKKKEKQKLKQRSTVEAFEHLFAKKKEVEAEKEMKKEERCKQAFALQEERCRKRLALQEERCNKRLALEEEKIRLDKEKIRLETEKFEFKRQLEEERIMNIDFSTMSYKQQQYYEGRQSEIIARRSTK